MRPNALFQLLLLTAAAVAWAAPRGTSFISMEEYKKYDDKVKHISQKQFLDQLREDQGVTWLIFFGSNQCGHCRAATPHWLNLQDQYFDSLESQGMRMRKIEFTENPG